MPHSSSNNGFGKVFLQSLPWLMIGAFLAALGIKVILIPNELIDGGIVGIAMIGSFLFGKNLLPVFLILFNLPFVILAYKRIGPHFVIQMLTALFLFAIALSGFSYIPEWFHLAPWELHGDQIEVIVLGGFILWLAYPELPALF